MLYSTGDRMDGYKDFDDYGIYDSCKQYCIKQQMIEHLMRVEKHKTAYTVLKSLINIMCWGIVLYELYVYFSECIINIRIITDIQFARATRCFLVAVIAVSLHCIILSHFNMTTAEVKYAAELIHELEAGNAYIFIRRKSLRKRFSADTEYVGANGKQLFSIHIQYTSALDRHNIKHFERYKRNSIKT